MDLPLGVDMLAAWSHATRLTGFDKTKIAFLDTETSGLSSGTGTYAFLVGLGFFDSSGFHVIQYFMRDPAEEPALLSALLRKMAAFNVLVTFNGKSFDVPLLNTRLTLSGFPLPFSEYDHIDLLHLARRLWRNRLASRALGDLEREILGFTREQDEVPGYLIPQVYFDYLTSGDARPLAGVFYHNVIDIVSLAALFHHLAEILDHPNSDHLHSLDVVAIARLYEENRKIEEAADLYEKGLAAGLPQDVFFNTIERFALLRKKQGLFDLAVSLWEKSARLGNLKACRELSKICEHNLKRPEEALTWAHRGQEYLAMHRMPRYQMQVWIDEFQKRVDRLEKKVSHDRNK